MQDFNERDKVKSTEEALKGFTQIGTEIRLNLEQINALASKLNTQFGETRERIGQIEGTSSY